MFDRRLKIFLIVVSGIMLVLMLRTLQIQVVQGAASRKRAESMGKKPTFVETVRGRILDVKGRVLAEDVPCIDAVVDYRAIVPAPDDKWLRDVARGRLSNRLGDEYIKAPKLKRDALIQSEILSIKADLAEMWITLARCPGMSDEKVAEARQDIVRRVEYRSRTMWDNAYELAVDKHDKAASQAWYSRWLMSNDKPPERDDFKKTIGDELLSYSIVHAIDPDTIAFLGKNLNHFPGLSLQPSTHRYYPYKEAGCHWIGNLAPVTSKERLNDPDYNDKRRRYDYSDLIGRTGVESLAERILRGTRGLVARDTTSNEVVDTLPADPGQDVTVSIDIELQQQVQDIFAHVKVPHEDDPNEVRTFHGAAVVIDVATGQVLAMASYPVFDPNTLDQDYAKLAGNHLDQPLLNRATMDVLEPGSSVKPMVGLWGMKTGVLGINEQIQCTGYMMYKGKKQSAGRCWVTRVMAANNLVEAPVNHPIPIALGHDLSFADALERSCNPFHETVADRLGLKELSHGFSMFGLGQPTGIGIPERVGRLPDSYMGPNPLNALWSAGIGQGQVAATPLQMANVVATIARGGIWYRPTLINSPVDPDKLRYAMPTSRPAKVDLQIPPGAIQMAHQGMWNVVHGRAGTGTYLEFPEVGVCGKTGSAQAAMFSIPVIDENGHIVPKKDADGKPIPLKGLKDRFVPEMVAIPPGTPEAPNKDMPWYRATGKGHNELTHGWYVGFAPASAPKISFCVLTEYGGTGGIASAAIAHEVLAALVEHGYLVKGSQ